MKRILYAITIMAFLFCACSEDKKEPIDVLEPDIYDIEKEILELTGCKPDDAKSIKSFKLFKDNAGEKYLYGSKLSDGLESFWISKFSESGKQLWEVVHRSNLVSNAYNPVEISNGSLVVGNAIKKSDLDVVGLSPVIINKDGNANYIKVFDDNYIYSDVSVYEDFFFTTVSRHEMDANKNAANRAAQISNNGEVIRLLPGGTDQLSFPKKDDKYIWVSDSIYVTINTNNVNKYTVLSSSYSPIWSFPVSLPDYNSCEMNLTLKDTILVASYYLDYADNVKDTISYNISPFTGKEVVELEDMFLAEKSKTVKKGDSFTIKLVFVPENAGNINIVWESSDQSVATVDRFGKVTAQSAGKCVIKARTEDGKFESTCDVTVLEPTIEDFIRVGVSGSIINVDGLILSANIIASFYNGSDKMVQVDRVEIYDTMTNKVIWQKENCGNVLKEQSLEYKLMLNSVYRPLLIWHYTSEGKRYEVECKM